jgi:hypothetical protein
MKRTPEGVVMIYETVYGKLGKWVGKPLAKLPHDLRHIANAYITQWQTLTPKQRTDRAIEVDRQRGLKLKLRYDRALRAENAAQLDPENRLAQVNAGRLLDQIERWEALQDGIASNLLAKEKRLPELYGELAALEAQFKAPYPALLVVDATPPEPQAGAVVAVDALEAQAMTPDPERRLALLRTLGGSAKYFQDKWKFTGITELVAREKEDGRKRSSQKTIRADLKEAAQAERDAKNAGFATGLGQR